MAEPVPSIGGTLRAIASIAAIAMIACARPQNPAVSPTPLVARDLDAGGGSPLVQVRNYSYSPVVDLVAWDDSTTGFGLRGSFRRDGSLIDDHRLFVSAYYVPVRSFFRAVAPSQTLQLTGLSRDAHYCFNYPKCSPYETFGARIPDA